MKKYIKINLKGNNLFKIKNKIYNLNIKKNNQNNIKLFILLYNLNKNINFNSLKLNRKKINFLNFIIK